MTIQRMYQLFFAGTILLLLTSVMSAVAASNTIMPSGIDRTSHSISVDDLKPQQCSALHLTNLITGSGNISGTLENDLILAGSGSDTISGEGGNDCILGGGGNDHLYGGPGNDVCIGGSGTDSSDDSCEVQH